jgi:ferric-dicitrate binding protein FerR (iron transport regulator)
VNTPPDLRLAELFVRYWDDALTAAETAELEERLATDPAAREWFQVFTLQAVAAADLRAAEPELARPAANSVPATPASARSPRRLSRRRALGYMGGLAAGVAAAVLGRWVWLEPARQNPLNQSVRLGSVRGTVTLRDADGTVLPTDAPVPAGGTVVTNGPGASALLFYPNGTNVALTEDSAVTLGPTGEDDRLRLDRGVIAADVRQPLVGGSTLTLATAQTVLTNGAGAIVTLYQAATVTEVGVQRGSVNVSAPTGRSLGELRGGELLTVRSDGDFQKQAIRAAAYAYELDLTRPLAAGWAVGHLEARDKEPILVPEFWFDPFYQKPMYQIRSDKAWARGFFQLRPDSIVRVRYRVARSGAGQVCFCVRTPDVRSPDTGMLEWNGTYRADPLNPKAWQTLEVRTGDMLDNRYPPKFGNPWIGFLLIFNTYETDLDLQVAEFRVVPPNPPGGVPE